MTGETAVLLSVVASLYVALHLGLLCSLKRGFRWIADQIDRWSGL